MKPYYQDSVVTIYHADCREILPQLPKVDLVLTDPPYKLSQAYSSNVDADNLIAVSMIWPVAELGINIVKPGGMWVMFYDTRILPLAITAMAHAGWKYLRGLTLYRRWGNAHQLHGWMSTSDFILVYCNPSAQPEFQGIWRHDVYIRDKPEGEDTGHMAQKPIFCVEHLISNCSQAGGIVLDPFMGSGTTLRAAKNLGHKATTTTKSIVVSCYHLRFIDRTISKLN